MFTNLANELGLHPVGLWGFHEILETGPVSDGNQKYHGWTSNQILIQTMTGWWCKNHLEKYESMGRMTSHIWNGQLKKWNHQTNEVSTNNTTGDISPPVEEISLRKESLEHVFQNRMFFYLLTIQFYISCLTHVYTAVKWLCISHLWFYIIHLWFSIIHLWLICVNHGES